jgi:hypothetical protein
MSNLPQIISPLLEVINELANQIAITQVTTPEEVSHLGLIYNKARSLQNEIELRRKELTAPLRSQVSAINDTIKSELQNPLDAILECCNQKSKVYLDRVRLEREKEEQERKQAAMELNAPELAYVPDVPVKVSSTFATITETKVKAFRIINEKLIPKKFLSVDEKKIKQAIDAGLTEIAGIEIYEETKVTMRKK